MDIRKGIHLILKHSEVHPFGIPFGKCNQEGISPPPSPLFQNIIWEVEFVGNLVSLSFSLYI